MLIKKCIRHGMPKNLGTDWQWREITSEEFFLRKPEEGSEAFGGWSNGQGETMTGWGRDGETAPRLATAPGLKRCWKASTRYKD